MGKREKKSKKKSKKRDTKEKHSRKYSAVVTAEDKAAQKEEKRARKKQALLGYSNVNNPFGDSQLSKPFTWHKKNTRDIAEGRITHAPTKAEARSRRDLKILEIKKVQKRREAREREKEEQEELRMLEMRLREAEQYQDWEQREQDFNDNQRKRKVYSRVKHGREEVIDVLAKNYLILDPPVKSVHDDPDKNEAQEDIAKMEIERREPSEIIEGLTLRDLEELLVEVKEFAKTTVDKPHGDYWHCLSILVTANLREARREEAREEAKKDKKKGRAPRPRVSAAIKPEIDKLYKGMRISELKKLMVDIQDTIAQGNAHGATIDIEYYETQLQQLREYTARARLKELHATMLEQRLDQLDGRAVNSEKSDALEAMQVGLPTSNDGGSSEALQIEDEEGDGAPDVDFEDLSPELEPHAPTEAESAELSDDDLCLSPELEPYSDDEGAAEEVTDATIDEERLKEQRRVVLTNSRARLVRAAKDAVAAAPDESAAAAAMYAAEMGKGGGDGDELTSAEVSVPAQIYSWTDKFRPRKPRYFNRVKTGYEWNKYNQTHYDHDNPPPKSVQGYKFNIFYPDMVDRTQVPKYFVEPADHPDFCILRFHGGPPYEDIAFKIVNKEWGYQRKRGFKCVFERGILHLYFNFQRHFYRR